MIKMNEEELQWLREISTTTGVSYSGDKTITTDFANKLIDYIKELEQLQNNWNELKKCIEEKIDYLTKIDGQNIPLKDSFEFCSMNELYQTGKYSGFMESFEKMQELEQGKDENNTTI